MMIRVTDPAASLSGRRDGFLVRQFSFARNRSNDLPPMEAAVFDEDVRRVVPADHYAREINPRHVAFQSLRIDGGLFVRRRQANPQLLEKCEIRMIPGERENPAR